MTETKKSFYKCDECSYICSSLSYWKEHTATAKHKRNTSKQALEHIQVTEKTDFSTKSMIYTCEKCNLSCVKLCQWNRHIATDKHKIQTNNDLYKCEKCNKKYKKLSFLQTHQEKCVPIVETEKVSFKTITKNNGYNNNDELINKLIQENQEMRNFFAQQNQELIKAMMEMSKTNPNIVNNTQNNNIQNRFNISVFLNERCKDAMNFSEFLDSIEVTREDLENNARLGFVNGMSKIIIDNLKKTDLFERSIHCTDFKRETIYIKDDNEWTKQEDQTKLNKAITNVSTKSIKTLKNWKDENPDYKDYDSEFYKLAHLIFKNSIGGVEKDTLYPKIIKKIKKEIILDKNIVSNSPVEL